MRGHVLVAITVLAIVGLPLLSPWAGGGGPTSIVYLESGPNDDRTLLVIEPLEPADPDHPDRIVFLVTHERGFMPRGSLSPDGGRVVLVRQPKGVSRLEGAEAILVNLEDDPGLVTVLDVPAFGLSTPFFSPAGAGPSRVLVTGAVQEAPPSDAEMRAGRLAEYLFTIREVSLVNFRVADRYEQRLTYLHPIGMGFVNFGPDAGGAYNALIVYRITHAGADIAAIDMDHRADPAALTNLGHSMARDFDLSDDGQVLIFLAFDPDGGDARIQKVYLTNGGLAQRLGNPVTREASPAWAGNSHAWYFARPPDVRGDDPPHQLFRAADRLQTGLPLDTLSSMTGSAPADEVLVEGGVAPGGRFVAVRSGIDGGLVHFLRDTQAEPQTARLLGQGGQVRVLGFK